MKEELANLVHTFEALGPIVGNAVKSGQLFKPRCELTEPDPDVLCEYDVRIPEFLSDHPNSEARVRDTRRKA